MFKPKSPLDFEVIMLCRECFYSIVGTVKKLQCVPYPSLYVDAISSEKKNLPTKISGMRVTGLKHEGDSISICGCNFKLHFYPI